MSEHPQWGFDVPNNLNIVWHRGTRSFNDMYARERDQEGFEKHNVEMGFRYIAPDQMASMARAVAFLATYKLAVMYPKMNFHFATYDLESRVPENDNNAPIRFDEEGKSYKKAKPITVYQHE